MQVRRYSRIEPMIFICFMLPYTVLANLLLFGSCCFSSLTAFFQRLGISLFYFGAIYSIFGMAAMLIKKRFQKPTLHPELRVEPAAEAGSRTVAEAKMMSLKPLPVT